PEFSADLTLMRASLAAHAGERSARRWLDPLLRQVETFGFHLHTLDVRQHARVHARAVSEFAGGAQLDVSEHEVAETATALPQPVSEETRALLETLRAVAALKREFPSAAIQTFVISGARASADVRALVWLAES